MLIGRRADDRLEPGKRAQPGSILRTSEIRGERGALPGWLDLALWRYPLERSKYRILSYCICAKPTTRQGGIQITSRWV